MDMRSVLVIDRSSRGQPGASYPNIKRVSLNWTCPVCDGPRGEPYIYHFFENDDYHICHRWDNPCGHVVKYVDVLKEGKYPIWVYRIGVYFG